MVYFEVGSSNCFEILKNHFVMAKRQRTSPVVLHNKVLTTFTKMVIRLLGDTHMMCSICCHRFVTSRFGIHWGRVHLVARPWVPISSSLTHMVCLLTFLGSLMVFCPYVMTGVRRVIVVVVRTKLGSHISRERFDLDSPNFT